MPTPSPAHARLARLAGRWEADETLHPPAFGPVEATTVNRMAVGGLFLVNEYAQHDGDAVVFRGFGVYGWDPARERYSMYWVDSMGAPPAATLWGTWDDDTLTFRREGPDGHHRYVYVLEGDDRYVFRIESSTDGETWSTGMTGIYTRISDP